MREMTAQVFDMASRQALMSGATEQKLQEAKQRLLDLIDRQPTDEEAQITVGMVEMLMGVCKTISECKKCPDKQCSKMLKTIKKTFGIDDK